MSESIDPWKVKDNQGRQGEGQIYCYDHILANIDDIHPQKDISFVSINRTLKGQGQRSRLRKGQDQIYIFGHISANIDHINSKQKTLALSQ